MLTSLPLSASAQSPDNHWHAAVGIAGGSINFQQNGAGGLAIPIRYDIATTHDGALSLGTNLKIGTEDADGVSFPVILALLLAGAAGNSPDFSNLSSGTSSNPSQTYSVRFFADFPLLLQYNWGMGTEAGFGRRFGWFAGGGVTYTVTGVSLNSAGHGTSENFFGWVADVGIRFARNKEIHVSTTFPFQNAVGPIQHPVFYCLTFAISTGR